MSDKVRKERLEDALRELDWLENLATLTMSDTGGAVPEEVTESAEIIRNALLDKTSGDT